MKNQTEQKKILKCINQRHSIKLEIQSNKKKITFIQRLEERILCIVSYPFQKAQTHASEPIYIQSKVPIPKSLQNHKITRSNTDQTEKTNENNQNKYKAGERHCRDSKKPQNEPILKGEMRIQRSEEEIKHQEQRQSQIEKKINKCMVGNAGERSIGNLKTFQRWRRFNSSIFPERDAIGSLSRALALSLARSLALVWLQFCCCCRVRSVEGFWCKYMEL